MPLSLSPQTRLLVIAPHPDDETIGAGGLIQQVREAGGEVRILLLTDGDNNPWPQRWLERRLWIGAAERERWGRRRRQEVVQALRTLDVPAAALHAFGWPDMGITASLRQDFARTVAAMAQQIHRYRPNMMTLPALGDRHPDHGAAHVLVRLALAESGQASNLLIYWVHGGPAEHPGERIHVDVTVKQRSVKLAAVAEHHSQMALSATRMRQWAGGEEWYERIEPRQGMGTRWLLPWRPSPLLMPRLRLTLAGPGGVRDWRWRDAPLNRDNAGLYMLSLPSGTDRRGPLFIKLQLDLPSPWIFDHWGWREL
ncbi:PIG-L deacetylase family protein [Dyella silvatica]|uniref:PIG-L deacetylase family protein n=1 Tax=Dyella silvatica TaxID=2992128 RepID=UPI00224DDA7E|nr:PIG-L deacetylase family protein [Dyella silvatica]